MAAMTRDASLTTFFLPEKVPEKTPGAWLTKLSMMAPGFRERDEGVELLLGLGLLLLLGGLLCGLRGARL